MNTNIDILLPIGLLIFAFMMKQLFSREFQWPIIFEGLCELPVDVMFLSMSFIIVSIVSVKHDHSSGILIFVFLNIILFPVILIWRFSRKKLDNQNKWWFLFAGINLLITSIIALYCSYQVKLNLNAHDHQIKKELNEQWKMSDFKKKIKQNND